MVTNPINKAALYDAGFAYPGHTEFLAVLTGAPGKQIMMLASPHLRVVPVTVHASLRNSIALLSTDAIVAAAHTTAAALRHEFGIAQPRLAIAGLNPHAGEQGALGDEETTIIAPAIAQLRAAGIDVTGPWPPDTMFTATARARYDVAICMYHDQALIPLKTLDMDHGVNVTLGLPIVRTSPDHGTAYDIAGKGVADPSSLIAAIELAVSLAERRATRHEQRDMTTFGLRHPRRHADEAPARLAVSATAAVDAFKGEMALLLARALLDLLDLSKLLLQCLDGVQLLRVQLRPVEMPYQVPPWHRRCDQADARSCRPLPG